MQCWRGPAAFGEELPVASPTLNVRKLAANCRSGGIFGSGMKHRLMERSDAALGRRRTSNSAPFHLLRKILDVSVGGEAEIEHANTTVFVRRTTNGQLSVVQAWSG